MGMYDWLWCYCCCCDYWKNLVLTRLCQILRGKIHDDDNLGDFISSYTDSSLRDFKRTCNGFNQEYKRKGKKFSYEVKRLTEGDCI